MKHKDKQIIQHILRYCQELASTAEYFGDSAEEFNTNHIFYNACSMAVFQIGELSKRLSDEFKVAHADLPWKELRGMRNLFAHDYESVDKDSLWGTIQNDIPVLREQMQGIIKAAEFTASDK